MGTNKLFCGATLWGGGGINQSKEVESCVDIITWIEESFQLYQVPLPFYCNSQVVKAKIQAPAVWKVDNIIHWINLYSVDKCNIGFPDTYPLDGDLSSG